MTKEEKKKREKEKWVFRERQEENVRETTAWISMISTKVGQASASFFFFVNTFFLLLSPSFLNFICICIYTFFIFFLFFFSGSFSFSSSKFKDALALKELVYQSDTYQKKTESGDGLFLPILTIGENDHVIHYKLSELF